ETVTARVYVKDSAGNGHAGAQIVILTGSGEYTSGVTDANGLVEQELRDRNYRLMIKFRRGLIESEPMDLSETVTFNTVKVKFLNSGTIDYQGFSGGWGTFQSPTQEPLELLPATYTFSNFHYHNPRVTITI